MEIPYYILGGKDGRRVVKVSDVTVWGKFFQDVNKRRINSTMIGDIWISTVFLGTDHNFGGRGRPVLFETMVFGGKLDQEQWRYCTYKEAEKGHERIVAKVKEAEGICN